LREISIFFSLHIIYITCFPAQQYALRSGDVY
jgi:hypothetical protein